MRVPIDGGTSEQVRGNTIADEVAISPDGRTLAFMTLIPQTQTVYQKLALVNLAANSRATRLFDIDPRGARFVQFTREAQQLHTQLRITELAIYGCSLLKAKGTADHEFHFPAQSQLFIGLRWQIAVSASAATYLRYRALRESLP